MLKRLQQWERKFWCYLGASAGVLVVSVPILVILILISELTGNGSFLKHYIQWGFVPAVTSIPITVEITLLKLKQQSC